MKNLIGKFVVATTFSLVATFSQASLIETTAQIEHNYGAGNYSPTSLLSGNSCDTLNADSVRIYDTGSGCGRFYDNFDFSALDFASVDSFELSLTFANVNNNVDYSFFGFTYFTDRENWNVRPGASASNYAYSDDQNISSGLLFDETNVDSDTFQDILDTQNFTLMFAEESISSDNFYLSNATLTVKGAVEVPEPAPLALFSLGLFVLGVAKKRKK